MQLYKMILTWNQEQPWKVGAALQFLKIFNFLKYTEYTTENNFTQSANFTHNQSKKIILLLVQELSQLWPHALDITEVMILFIWWTLNFPQ